MQARRHCPICSEEAPVIFARPYNLPVLRQMVERPGCGFSVVEQSYEIRHCRLCGLSFQTWVLEVEEAAAWYAAAPQNFDFWQEIGRQKLHWFAHMAEEVLILRQLIPTSPPVVLDFGCNWGKWANTALAHGCRVHAVEINRQAAEFCTQRGIEILSLNDLAADYYDFINVDQVAEHLSEPREVVERLVRSLKPGGFLKLSTPENRSLPRRLAAAHAGDASALLNPSAIDALAPLEHVNLFTNQSLKMLATVTGLRLFRVPILLSLGAGQLWNMPRQMNRNLITPFKRWAARRTYLWFRKSATTDATLWH